MSSAADLRILVTGANGFVGPHLVDQVRRRFGDRTEFYLSSMVPAIHAQIGAIHELDVTNSPSVEAAISEFAPTHVVHLAGLAAITTANANAQLAWDVHLFGTLNVANAILKRAPDCVMLSVGSGQVYGASARTGQPLDEATLLVPTNNYEVTKAAGDLGVGALTGQGLRSVRLRPFNHTGRGQSLDFVIPSLAMQIARIEAGLQPPSVKVGNLEAERDFMDVRDVTAAYSSVISNAAGIPPGTILNIASGIPRRIHDLLDRLLAMSRVPIAVEADPQRMRPSDTPRFVGDGSLARRLLDWSPQYTIDATLADVLDDCRLRVSNAA